MNRESSFANSYNKVAENSQTAAREEAQNLIKQPVLPEMDMGTTMTGLALSGGKKILGSLVDKGLSLYSQPTRDALAHALMQKGPQAEALFRDLKGAQPTSRAKIIRALTSQSALNASIQGPDQNSGSNVGKY